MTSHRKITQTEANILRLIARSIADSEGWCNVSSAVFPLVKGFDRELVEINGNKIRLTPVGKILSDWT